ncbi:MAG: M1 family metallopeptidase [Sphingobacteriaceae bacterium]|nr:M1 family metallopeptidase [Sphingobacteriaceae bacterium]
MIKNYLLQRGLLLAGFLFSLQTAVQAQNLRNNPTSNHGNKFEQLGTILPDANTYRTASGAPGHQYWQQQADYEIDAQLDEVNLVLNGKERVTYTNHSPDALAYLWLQLDENQHDPNNEANFFNENQLGKRISPRDLERLDVQAELAGHGVKIKSVTDDKGRALPYTINQTMMRIDLPKALAPGKKISFRIAWSYRIPERNRIGGRGGYELFEDGNAVFTITQWFPRLCVYSDYQGWNNKQFTGRGEFSLPFGNYKVRMDVPEDHLIVATGECSNYSKVLTTAQLQRWKSAQTATEPVEIVTLEEAKQREKAPAKGRKVWEYSAKNVRDFAWGSSRKFVWDVMPVQIEGKKVMAMSAYPKEAYGLYRKYSTKVVAHTLKVYSKFTIPYPYPVAISVEASNGMEYPMICFNYGRTNDDGTYTEQTKYGMIGVIIHEVGHNFFPMIVNSDERNWSWMDEGLNTFVQFLAEQEFDNNYPSRRGPAHKIVDYMKLPVDQLEPIMTNSENIVQFGPNAYSKPATALNILRETIMGRELFDHAFKTYSTRWAFRHPSPADFFRTMEDASGVDLDWFWRGWFYDIEPVEISLDSVIVRRPELGRLVSDTNQARPRRNRAAAPEDEFIHISRYRNLQAGLTFLVDVDTTLRDFYFYYTKEQRQEDAELAASAAPVAAMGGLDSLSANEFKEGGFDSKYLYELHFSNKGGLVMPIILRWEYADGSTEEERISAYIWRKDENRVVKTFMKNKPVQRIVLDPWRETADIDESNHVWPREGANGQPTPLQLFQMRQGGRNASQGTPNPMQIRQGK